MFRSRKRAAEDWCFRRNSNATHGRVRFGRPLFLHQEGLVHGKTRQRLCSDRYRKRRLSGTRL
jgi:hypothetical protein